MSNPIYVDKRHYDALLRKYMCTKRELGELKEDWTKLKDKVQDVDGRVLDEMHKYVSIEEERAYIEGAINVLIALGWDIEKMEENRYVSPSN